MALVEKGPQLGPGGGILVDPSTVGRPIGDTSSSAVFVSDLPKNYSGGDDALQFALGQLFGNFGKIKKVELYMDEGILETKDFKGEALVVFHPNKLTGTRDAGDPVYEACKELDGKVRVLGYRNWRMRCEPAVWQKQGFNVKDKAKKVPCVEIGNLWEYEPSTAMTWFMEIQEVIRKHVAEHIKDPFVKVEPSEGKATIYCRGAHDAMKLASVMKKSYFMGRKVGASLCRKEKPLSEAIPKAARTWSLPSVGDNAMIDRATIAPGKLDPEVAAAIRRQVEEMEAAQAPEEEEVAEPEPVAPTFLLREGCHVVLVDLVSKPENNGKQGEIICYLEKEKKYQVALEGRFVKLKPENVVAVEEPLPKRIPKSLEEDDEEDEQLEASAQDGANELINPVRAPVTDADLVATVCVDPSLLGKKDEEEEDGRGRSRSRERWRKEKEDAIAARVRASKAQGQRCGWVVSGPEPKAVEEDSGPKEPDESREELMKLSVSALKQLLMKYGKSGRGCLEKKDFVDRLKPTTA